MSRAIHLSVAATLVAAFLWGTSFIVNDEGLQHVEPATFATLRFVIAGVIGLAVMAATRNMRWPLLRNKWLWGMAAANAAAYLLQYAAQSSTTPARTALLVNVSAFVVAVLERFVFKERLGWPRIVALCVGVAGANFLIVGGGDAAGGQLTGDLLALASGMAWAGYFVVNRQVLLKTNDLVGVTSWTFALTALVLLPSLFLDERPLQADALGWAAIFYAGVVTTAVAFALWAYGLRKITATASSVLLLFEILVATALSFAIGRESFTLVDGVGALLLVAALVGMTVIVEKSPSNAKTRTRERL